MKAVSAINASARERFEAYKRGEYIPPPKPTIKLSEEALDGFLTVFARRFAEEYRKDTAE